MKNLPDRRIREFIFFGIIVLPLLVLAIQIHTGSVIMSGVAKNIAVGLIAFVNAYALNRVFA